MCKDESPIFDRCPTMLNGKTKMSICTRTCGREGVSGALPQAVHYAVLNYLSGQRMKNATLRERFGVDSRNAAQISAVIRKSLDESLIRSADPERPRSGYVPYWA